jgi:hypothetical protein
VPEASDVEDSRLAIKVAVGLEECCVSRYDEAIRSLGTMGKEMSSRLSVAPQVLFLPATSNPKLIEIP